MPNLLARTRAPDQSPDQPPRKRTEPREHGLSETKRVGSVPDRDPSSDGSLALRLSDDQLSEVMHLCRPLALPCRNALLRILAHELRGRREIGDGELHRISRRRPSTRCLASREENFA